MSDIAIAHDAYTSDGGAERVAAQLARLFDAPLYVTICDDEVVPEEIDHIETWTNRAARFWNRERWWVPRTVYWAGRHLYRRQRATQSDHLSDYDVVIQTKGARWPYVPRTEQTVIRYVHSPPRRHYDQFHKTSQSFPSRMWSLANRILEPPILRYADKWVANSDVVKRRIVRYYDIDPGKVTVVYPPVEMPNVPGGSDKGYYLYLGRLAQNKRIGLVCDIARETNHDIHIAGDGPEKEVVESTDASNLTYHGRVSEFEKWRLLKNARGTLFFAEDEDFGIVPIESMAAGTPVIGVNEGFTKYQIYDGKNGCLTTADLGAVRSAIKRYERGGVSWDADDLHQFAQQFGVERFNQEMRAVVKEARAASAVTPDIHTPEKVER